MRQGTINCKCGQMFYFETAYKIINCIKCGKEHEVTEFPFKPEIDADVECSEHANIENDVTLEEGEENGVDF